MPVPAQATLQANAPSTSIEALRQATERGDAEAVGPLLAVDISFHSPLTSRARFEGRDEVVALLRDVFCVLTDVTTSPALAGGDDRAFRFEGRVRNEPLGAVMYARFNDRGLISEITIYGRPLPGAATLFSALPPRVSARRRGPAVGFVVGVLARPMAVTLRAVDRCVPWFL